MDGRGVPVVLAVVVIVAAVLTSSYVTVDRQEEEVSITATVIDMDEFIDPSLDISMQDLIDTGFSYGDHENLDTPVEKLSA